MIAGSAIDLSISTSRRFARIDSSSRRHLKRSAPLVSASLMRPGERGAPSRSKAAASATARPELPLMTAVSWPNHGQRQKRHVVKLQRGSQPSTEERGFSGARGAQDHKEFSNASFNEAPDPIEPSHDRSIAAEKHSRILRLKGAQASVRRALGVPRRRPRETPRVETGAFEPSPKQVEPRLSEGDALALRSDFDLEGAKSILGRRARTIAIQPSSRRAIAQMAPARRSIRKCACEDSLPIGTPRGTTWRRAKLERPGTAPPRSGRRPP